MASFNQRSAFAFSIISFLFQANSILASPPSAKLFFQRIAGVPLLQNDPRYAVIQKAINEGDLKKAAQIATEDPRFVNLTAKSFASRFISQNDEPFIPLNDSIAMIMGVIRDNTDSRELLTGDFLYTVGNKAAAKPSLMSNAHYDQFEKLKKSSFFYFTRKTPQWDSRDGNQAAGLLTTRAWAQAYYMAGTNRRAVVGTFNSFLCSPIDEWKQSGLDDSWVRRDIDRRPGGKPETYQTTCRTCHALMDSMAGAFSLLDYNNGLVFSSSILSKYNQNAGVYPDGYVTLDPSWTNFAIYGSNARFGFGDSTSGSGIHEFAEMIANSEGFPKCMAKRVIRQICMKDLSTEDQAVQRLARKFKSSNYGLKTLFMEVAADEVCGFNYTDPVSK